jgi:hypothetical protein
LASPRFFCSFINMGFFSKLFQKDPLENSVLVMNDNIEQIIPDHCDEKFNVLWQGDYQADPKSLVYYICVQTDKAKKELYEDRQLNRKFQLLLENCQYPEDARSSVRFKFESQQTVDRECSGSWNLHLK